MAKDFVSKGSVTNHSVATGSSRPTPAGGSAVETGSASITPVLTVEDAAVRLGNRIIWQDATFDVAPGEFLAVLGPNGAGKSTLIKAILGLIPLSHGSIRIAGLPPREGRRAVGYVPQRRSFGNDVRIRGLDLVRLGLDGTRWGPPLPFLANKRSRAAQTRVEEVLDMVGARQLANQPIGELSGGEQQRINIAQALVTYPQLLLLDEPLDALDLAHQREVSEVIRHVSEASGAAVLLVAHDVNPLLRHVDRLIYLAQGRVAVGGPNEIITSETLSRLYGSPIEVLRTQDGRMIVVGQPEGMPCEDFHSHGHKTAGA